MGSPNTPMPPLIGHPQKHRPTPEQKVVGLFRTISNLKPSPKKVHTLFKSKEEEENASIYTFHKPFPACDEEKKGKKTPTK
jgi:hypothetical protein